MTQDTPSLKPKNNLAFLLLLTAITMGNIGGLFILYQQHQDDKRELKNILRLNLLRATDLKSQILSSVERQSNLETEVIKLKKNLAQITLQKHDNALLRIEWLLHQAEWQLNVLKQVRYSKAYLHQAKKIALSKDLHSVADALHQDLMNLNQSGITPLDQILSTIVALKQKLDDANPIPIKAAAPILTQASPTTIQSVIAILKPFIKIEHYHETPAKFLSAEDQSIIIQNLELLLSEIQYAAISAQPTLFKQLLSMFEKEAALLDLNPSLSPWIATLKTTQLRLPHPIHLKSLSMVQELIQEKSAS